MQALARVPRIPFGARIAALAASCVAASTAGCSTVQRPLEREPWSAIDTGTVAVGASTGWAVYEADVELSDTSGSPVLGSGTDTAELDPVFGAAAKLTYFLHPQVSLGAIVERRAFDPDIVRPLASDIDADEYETYHFILSSRFFTTPLGEDRRWKAFGGLDAGYVPYVDLDATVIYAPGFQERVTLEGDGYFTLGVVGGLSYLVADRLSLEIGAFYEWSLDASEDTLTLNIPNGLGGTDANLVDGKVFPEGLIGFIGFTYYL
jgi:hypothetical protein